MRVWSIISGLVWAATRGLRLAVIGAALVAATALAPSLVPFAAAQNVAALVEIDSISVGERTSLVLLVAHDGSRRAVFPDETGSAPPEAIGLLGDFELLRRRASGFRMLADNSRIDSVVYEATTFAVDTSFVIPTVFLASEIDTLTAVGLPVFVPVRSVVPDDATDVHDLAPLAEFPRAWWPWILAVVLVGVALWLWRRHRNRPVVTEPESPDTVAPESALQEAIRRLNVLGGVVPDSPGLSGPFFDELSDILRTYVSRRTGEHALEMTTTELVVTLRAKPGVKRERIAEIEQILRAADLVKFADYHPPADRARAAHGATRVSIERFEADSPAVDAAPDSDVPPAAAHHPQGAA